MLYSPSISLVADGLEVFVAESIVLSKAWAASGSNARQLQILSVLTTMKMEVSSHPVWT